MKNFRLAIFACFVGLLLLNCRAEEKCLLARDGNPNATIVVSSKPNQSAWFAAGELKYHLDLITGGNFRIVTEEQAEAITGTKIYVGESAFTKKAGITNDKFDKQEFTIIIKNDYIVLAGKDNIHSSFPVRTWSNINRVEGRFGKALFVDGKSGVLAIEDSNWNDAAGTIQFWVKIEGASSGTILRIEGVPWTYHLLNQEGRKIRYATFDGKQGSAIESAELNDGWHYIMATWDAGSKSQELFVDGKSCGRTEYRQTQCHTAELLAIGAMVEPFVVPGPAQIWKGVIDDLRILKVSYPEPSVPQSPFRAKDNTIVLLDFDEDSGVPREKSGLIRTNLPPDAFAQQGTCYAVYDFLERFCKVRWYAPGEDGLVYDKLSTLEIPVTNITRKPQFEYRWSTSNGVNPERGITQNVSKRDKLVHSRRTRSGGRNFNTNHSFNGYYDRFWKKNNSNPGVFEGEHPEYFAKGYPDRPPQMCFSSPEFIAQVVKDARDYFDGKGAKYGAVVGEDYFAVVPNDVESDKCKCEQCQSKIDRDPRHRFFTSGKSSALVWDFVNKVAREIAKSHPRKYIANLAYFDYAYYPRGFDVETNVLVGPCLHSANWWSPAIKQNDLQFYKEWAVKAKGRIHCLWMYQCFPREAGEMNGFKIFPGFHSKTIVEQMKMFADDGVRGIFLCGVADYIDGWLTFKLMDDPAQDAEKLLDEFFSRFYGKAAKPMKDIYYLIQETYMNTDNYPEEVRSGAVAPHQSEVYAWKYLGTNERMAKLGELIAQAEALSAGTKEYQRVQIFKKDFWEEMLQGKRRWEEKQGNKK
jgi:hypothetical protein